MQFRAKYVIIKRDSVKKEDRSVKLIVCLDETRGMMFNRRRQSRDSLLIADIICHVNGAKLLVSPYSAPLFDNCDADITVVDDPIDAATENDYCFIENTALPESIDCISELIIYRWNRIYPTDRRFLLDISSMRSVMRVDFKGSSHDKITKEVFVYDKVEK